MTAGGAFAPRFDRQARLPEIGVAGQLRLARGRAEVRGQRALERDVEAEYLARAGVGEIVAAPDQDAEPFAHAALFSSDASRAVGAGAWRALGALRRLLRAAP